MKKTTILFIQLPLVDHSYGYIHGNIDYAPAALSGSIKHTFGDAVSVETLPFLLANFASDTVILRYIENIRPDIISFTSYLWNIERNLDLAKKIKEKISPITIVFGGPEINPGSIAFQETRKEADYFVSGEGEWFFRELLSSEDVGSYTNPLNNNNLVIQPPDKLIPVQDIFEPYTGKRLNSMIDGSIFLELTRGCPYRCTYCYYSKNCAGVRELPFEYLTRAIEGNTRFTGLKEIYILSPTFNKTKDFIENLKRLAKINRGKNSIRLHTEMRAAGIDTKTARLLHKAGFRSMEVGLQTLNPKALERIGRKGDPDKELKGMLELQKAGIDLKIGIIPGLPGDDPESFIKTIDRLTDLGFEENIELYPLMILPGTGIQDHANKNGIEYLKKPPYYYHNGWGISFDDIKSISAYVEEKTGFTRNTPYLPDFSSGSQGLRKGVYFNGANPENWNSSLYTNIIETNVFNFFIDIPAEQNNEIILRGLSKLLPGLPGNELYTIIFYCDTLIEESKISALLYDIEKDNFYRRLNIFNDRNEGLRFRFFQVSKDWKTCMEAYSRYHLIEPVFNITLENHMDIYSIEENLFAASSGEERMNLLVSGGFFHEIKDFLVYHYSERPEMLAFEEEEEQAQFYSIIEFGFIRYPFSFRIDR